MPPQAVCDVIKHFVRRVHCLCTANTIFLDIWRTAGDAYGSGIFLQNVRKSKIIHNDVQHQMNGMMFYDCDGLSVARNVAGYNSGFGMYLSGTSHSTFAQNSADFCNRWYRSNDKIGCKQSGHLGADAAGFVIVRNSNKNLFAANFARGSGDGFFLCGYSPQTGPAPCNGNRFFNNDGSNSPNIAFEATFSMDNIFRGNRANNCNYGFWLGFSSWTNVLENEIAGNHRAGIAAENAHRIDVLGNGFAANSYGVLAWSREALDVASSFPDCLTSYDWTIARNKFDADDIAVRIIADADHGTRLLPHSRRIPYAHQVTGNTMDGCDIGIDLIRTDRTVLGGNAFSGSRTMDVHEDGTSNTRWK